MRASVFSGSFDLAAARSVCHDAELPATNVLEALTGLVDKSIVLRERRAGMIRFRMLETLREYGAQRLRRAGHDYNVRRAAHRDGIAELMASAAADWFGPRQVAWIARMRVEQPNIRAALEYCLTESGDVRLGLHMAGGAWFLWVTAYLAEGRVWLDRLLAASPEPTPERALALCTDAFVMCLQGDPDPAEELASECLAMTGHVTDGVVIGFATEMLAFAAFLHGDVPRAEILFDEASAAYDDAGGPADLRAVLLVQYAAALMLHGDVDRAARLFDEVCSMCIQHDEQWVLSYGLWGRSFVHFARGDLDGALQLARESLRIKRTFGDTLGLSLALDTVAWILADKGEARQAARLLGTASRAWASFGAQLFGSKAFLAERERCMEITRRALGATAYEAAFAEGSSLGLDQVVATMVESPAAVRRVAATGDARLTDDEWHVADLVAQRLTDPEIASALAISLRSVRVHVEAILAKLGLENRADIASVSRASRPR
jgi:non-specific serine/threonine protein kinase